MYVLSTILLQIILYTIHINFIQSYMYMHRKIGLWVWNIVQSGICRELDQGYLLASELLGAEAVWLISRPTDPVTAAGTSWCSVDEAHVPSGREAGMTRHLSHAHLLHYGWGRGLALHGLEGS